MSVLDDASKAGGGLALPVGATSAELKGDRGQWVLVFETSGGVVKVPMPNLQRGYKLLERALASLERQRLDAQ